MARQVVRDLKVGEDTGSFIVKAHGLPGEDAIRAKCKTCGSIKWFPYQQFFARKNCGCQKASNKDVFTPTTPERKALDAMVERYLGERARYIPIHLREFWVERQISPRWHPNNPDRYRNFIEDVGHKKPGQIYALLDPSGDFIPDNFFWKWPERGNARSDTTTVSD